MRGRKKHLDAELNLVPFIDLLSVCICFLLITAVWLNVGSMNVKQAIGGQPASETEKRPVLWTFMDTAGALTLDVRDAASVPQALRKFKINATEGHTDYNQLVKVLTQLRTVEPTLRTALIQPKGQTAYEDIIELMDHFKKAGLADLGVVPL